MIKLNVAEVYIKLAQTGLELSHSCCSHFYFCKIIHNFCSMQVEGFLKLMQKQIQSTGKRGFFSKKSVGPQVREKFTFEDMLCFQKVKLCCASRKYVLSKIYLVMKC